jgi:hypothetical protein
MDIENSKDEKSARRHGFSLCVNFMHPMFRRQNCLPAIKGRTVEFSCFTYKVF